MKKSLMTNRKMSGFTLIELTLVLAIISILATITHQSISNWLPNYRLRAAATDINAIFQRTRMEAIKRNTNIVISFTSGAYSPGGRVGSYLVFIDDGTGAGGIANNSVRDGSELILSQKTTPANVSLITANFSGTSTPGYTGQGLPLSNRIGSVQLKNSNLRRYRASLSLAGSVLLDVSSDDGATWN